MTVNTSDCVPIRMTNQDGDHGSVRISVREMYQEQRNLVEAVTKLTALLENNLPAINEKLADHETRIRRNASYIGLALGAIALIGFATPIILRFLP